MGLIVEYRRAPRRIWSKRRMAPETRLGLVLGVLGGAFLFGAVLALV